MLKKVSIILPVYNAEEFLKRCIESVLNQTYSNVELIALNDGSHDSSLAILNEYQIEFPTKIKVVNQENMGVARTRNKGIQLATGDYLMFIDNDDYFDVDYVEKFVKEIESGDYDLVLGGFKRPTIDGKIVEQVKLNDTEYSKYKIVAGWAKIFKLDFIKNNNIEFFDTNIGEDIPFSITAIKLTDKIKIIDYVGYNWFYNLESVSSTNQKSIKNDLHYDVTLKYLYTQLKNRNVIFDDYLEYYFIKSCVWYFFYSTRKTPYRLVKETFNDIFKWLEGIFPNYRNNRLLRENIIKSEDKRTYYVTKIFVKIINSKLANLFMLIYSKI